MRRAAVVVAAAAVAAAGITAAMPARAPHARASPARRLAGFVVPPAGPVPGHVFSDEARTRYGLDGSRVPVLVYDNGPADRFHPDLASRMAQTKPDPTSGDGSTWSWHATFVAGILGGDGSGSTGPVADGSTKLTAAAPQGATSLTVDAGIFVTGNAIRFDNGETYYVTKADASGAVQIRPPLDTDHDAGETVTIYNPPPPTGSNAGVAPAVPLLSWGARGDLYDDSVGWFATDLSDANAAGVNVVNMSMANAPSSCDSYGDYGSAAQDIDSFVRDTEIPFVEAAGNARGSSQPPNCKDVMTISPTSSAKNALVVGNQVAGQAELGASSSWGPTMDGRVKPDLAAPGCASTDASAGIVGPAFNDVRQWGTDPQGNPAWVTNDRWDQTLTNQTGTVAAHEPRDTYADACGTSAAAPVVSGATALLIQEWRKLHGDSTPDAATLKAILLASADRRDVADLPAPSSGADATSQWPNYRYGFGFLDITAAAKLVADDAQQGLISRDSVKAGSTVEYQVYVPGGVAPQVLLAWDDPAGQQLHLGQSQGDIAPTKELRDNLDVQLVAPDGSTTFDAWTPDPSNPDDLAERKLNVLDNVEYATGDPQPDGGVWTVRVSGVSFVDPPSADYAQPFTLVRPPLAASLSIADTEVVGRGTRATTATFTITRSRATGASQTVHWQTQDGTAVAGTDYDAASDTVTFGPDDVEKTVTVKIEPITDIGPNKTFTVALSDPQPAQELSRPVATGTIVSDSPFDVIAKTGDVVQTKPGGPSVELQSLGPDVSINDAGDVAFVATLKPQSANGAAGNGLFVGNGKTPPHNVDPSLDYEPGRALDDHVQLNDDGVLIAKDRLAGSPPHSRIRVFDARPNVYDRYQVVASGGTSGNGYDAVGGVVWDPVTQSYAALTTAGLGGFGVGDLAGFSTDAGSSGGTGTAFDSVNTPALSNTGKTAFAGLIGGEGYVFTGRSPSTQQSEPLQLPVIAQVADDGSVVYENSSRPAIVLADEGFSQPVTLACTSGCGNPGFQKPADGSPALGNFPGVSADARIVVYYGNLAQPQPGDDAGPGIFASIDVDGTWTTERIAGIGSSDITGFFPKARVGVSSTEDTQHAVTVVFQALDADGKKAIYSARLGFPGPNQPANQFTVSSPGVLVKVGDHVPALGDVADLGLQPDAPTGDLTGNASFAVNSHDRGDVAFWAKTTDGTEGIVRKRVRDTPLLLIPGIGGSKLYDLNQHDSDGNPLLLWPVIRASDDFYRQLRLDSGVHVTVGGIVRQAEWGIVTKPVYAPLLDALVDDGGYRPYDIGTYGENREICDVSQDAGDPDLFVFTYDWRLPIEQNAQKLGQYMRCIQRFYPGQKVNILAHSMGGLLARREILADPDFAKHVDAFVALASPWLGAPKMTYVLRSGDFESIGHGTINLVSGDGIKAAVETMPAAHELLPSQAYFSRAPDQVPPVPEPWGQWGVRIDGRVDSNGDPLPPPSDPEVFDYAKTKQVLDFLYPAFTPGSTNEQFHDAAQDSIATGLGDIDFYDLYGKQQTDDTIGQILETTLLRCNTIGDGRTCFEKPRMSVEFVAGDGTVPRLSATAGLSDLGTGPHVHVVPFVSAANDDLLSHNGLLGNTDVQQYVIDTLSQHGGPAPVGSVAPQQQLLVRSLQARRARAAAAATGAGADAVVQVDGASSVDLADADGNATADGYGAVPDVGVYRVGADSFLVHDVSSSPVTTTFTTSGGPLELQVADAPGSDATAVTRYVDASLPAGTAVRVTTGPTGIGAVHYDSDGDGTFDATLQPTVSLTGAAAADATPPTISISRQRGADGTTVTLTGNDAGSGVASIWYSADGSSYRRYTGPFTIDPTTTFTLDAIAEDRAGNRTPLQTLKVGEPVSLTPVASSGTLTLDENTSGSATLAATNPSGEPLTFAVTQPAHGTVAVSGGTITYTPDHNFYGTDSITFTADDGFLTSLPATVEITVNHVNQAPDLTLAPPSPLPEGGTITLTASAADPEGDAVTYDWHASGGTLTPDGATATLSADDGPAQIAVHVTATDAEGASRSADATVTVTNVAPSVTVAAPTPASQVWGKPVTLSGSATDPSAPDTAAGLAASWSFGDGGSGSGFTTAHVYADAGTYTARLSAIDKDGGAGVGSTSVTVAKRASHVVYTGSTSAPYGFVTLSAALSDAVDPASARLGGRKIVFIVGTQSFAATTDAAGNATLVPPPLAPGSYPVTVSFATDAAYLASSTRATLAISSSLGKVTGTSLVPASGGSASLTVSNAGSGITGTLDYTSSTLTLHAVQLGPLGIRTDGHAAWLAGVDTLGRKVTVYVEDNGPGSADVFKLTVNGVAQTTGPLSGGDVTVARSG